MTPPVTREPLTHEAAREYLAEEALGLLPPYERERVEAHVRSCPLCQRELGEMREVVGALALLTPPVEFDEARRERVRSRLLARIRVASPPAEAGPVPPAGDRSRAPRGRWALPPWSGWLTAAGVATLLLTHHTFHRPLLWGWLAAWFFALLALGLGAYVLVLRARLAAYERGPDEDA